MDRLCQYATGVSDAAAQCKRLLFRQQRAELRWSDSITAHLAHALTDVASWPRLQAASQVSSLSAACTHPRAILLGRSILLPLVVGTVCACSL